MARDTSTDRTRDPRTRQKWSRYSVAQFPQRRHARRDSVHCSINGLASESSPWNKHDQAVDRKVDVQQLLDDLLRLMAIRVHG